MGKPGSLCPGVGCTNAGEKGCVLVWGAPVRGAMPTVPRFRLPRCALREWGSPGRAAHSGGHRCPMPVLEAFAGPCLVAQCRWQVGHRRPLANSPCGNEDWPVNGRADPCAAAPRARRPGSSSPGKGFGLFQLIFPAQGLRTALLQRVRPGSAQLPPSPPALSLPDVSPMPAQCPLMVQPEPPCPCQGAQEQGPTVGES